MRVRKLVLNEREAELRELDERIGEALQASSAELRASPAWGKPLPDDGFFEAPPELRLAFKVLRNAGHVPEEVALMQELQRLRDALRDTPAGPAADALRRRIDELALLVELRVERLARTLTL